jgi:hypothetical protein
MSALFSALKRAILWDYPRASWQYDIIVAVILAFIFLTPRDFFRDQPRIPNTRSVAMLQHEDGGGDVYWIDPQLLQGVPEGQRISKATEILSKSTRKPLKVSRVQPIHDEVEEELKGYMAFTRP